MNHPEISPTHPATLCENLADLRQHIDKLDADIVKLLVERAHFVARAASFKTSRAEVRIPERVETVINHALSLTTQQHGNTVLVERIYRAMIDAYIAFETTVYDQLHNENKQ